MRAEEEEVNAPLRERVAIMERLIKEDEAKETRLLDLYLAGEFDKTILNARKQEIQGRLSTLRREKNQLLVILQTKVMYEATEAGILEYAGAMRKGLGEAELYFEQKRALMLDSDMRIFLGVNEGKQTITPGACFADGDTRIM